MDPAFWPVLPSAGQWVLSQIKSALEKAEEANDGRLTHFFAQSEHGKGQCHFIMADSGRWACEVPD
jgi:hypothetical protein